MHPVPSPHLIRMPSHLPYEAPTHPQPSPETNALATHDAFGVASSLPELPAPMDGKYGRIPVDFINRMPKTDLHVHLDGCVRIPTLIELAKTQNVQIPAYTVEELKQKVFKPMYANLEEYLVCFGVSCSVLQDKDALERVAYELAMDCFAEGIRYLEVRFAPQLHVNESKPDVRSISLVLQHVNAGLSRAKHEINQHPKIVSGEEPFFEYGIIVCALRMFNSKFSPYYCSFCSMHEFEEEDRVFSLASMALVCAAVEMKEACGIPIVGLDIAGAEKGYPASTHLHAYQFAQKKHLGKTVHAGEGYGPESIFQAITDLYAERIGHGFHLFSVNHVYSEKNKSVRGGPKAYVEGLIEHIADRRITFEVCLTSNIQTMPELKGVYKNHNFQKMLDHRISVTLGTDNRTVSHTNILKEYQVACSCFDLTPKQLKDLVITGFKRSFFPQRYIEKRKYVRQVLNFYEKLEREYGIVHEHHYYSAHPMKPLAIEANGDKDNANQTKN